MREAGPDFAYYSFIVYQNSAGYSSRGEESEEQGERCRSKEMQAERNSGGKMRKEGTSFPPFFLSSFQPLLLSAYLPFLATICF
jgi:hypothetical protein